jgi:hypothetical protein
MVSKAMVEIQKPSKQMLMEHLQYTKKKFFKSLKCVELNVGFFSNRFQYLTSKEKFK